LGFLQTTTYKLQPQNVLELLLLELFPQCPEAVIIDYEKIIAGQLAEPPGFQDAIKACVESLSQP